MLRILIADDHPIVRQGLKQILAGVPDMVVAGEASDGVEALKKALEANYDIVLLDIAMPVKNGIEVLKELKRERPSLPVLILSIHPEKDYALRAVKAGASGYLTKSSTSFELVNAIREVAHGKIYISDATKRGLVDALHEPANRAPHETLSNREYEIMRLLANGTRIKDIATSLALSENTVSAHRTHILKKMGMASNAELTRYVIERKLPE